MPSAAENAASVFVPTRPNCFICVSTESRGRITGIYRFRRQDGQWSRRRLSSSSQERGVGLRTPLLTMFVVFFCKSHFGNTLEINVRPRCFHLSELLKSGIKVKESNQQLLIRMT
ncbi:hypothetical protein AVEN_136840-1 [Araneus ventricosus]|uniref:Uncharacterized protein n=1 Tax=Araneus ventricosus TaxID=182803 RepID=A0A4Y2G3H6_ARAVE|nr:hypothetical protein AVEN_136840-1 [Araneus ventricosus]